MASGMLERSQVVPNVYRGFYEDGRRDVVAEADERYMMNLSAWQLFFWEQLIDRKVYLGDQRYLNLYSGLSYEHQKFIFNASMPVVNMVCGRQRQHRKGTRMIAVHGASDQTASQATNQHILTMIPTISSLTALKRLRALPDYLLCTHG